MLFPYENSIVTLSCINLSSPSLCDSHMGLLPSNLHKIAILQNKAIKIITRRNEFQCKPHMNQPTGLETEQASPI